MKRANLMTWAVSLTLFSSTLGYAMEAPVDTIQALRQAKTEAEMDEVLADFSRSDLDLVQGLIALLSEAKTQEVKIRACFLLGETRNPRSTRALVENLLVQAEVPERYTKLPLWGRYPCQEALAKIGKPAEDTLFGVLSNPASDEIKAAALRVLQQIEGWRGAVFVLEQAWERAGADERKGLEKALEQARKEAGH